MIDKISKKISYLNKKTNNLILKFMGKYVNSTSFGPIGSSADEKCTAIIKDGGEEIMEPKVFIKNVVCVVDNGFFGAAGYAYDERELAVFKRHDGRHKRWFIWNKVEKFAC